jgi:hypothetical protein
MSRPIHPNETTPYKEMPINPALIHVFTRASKSIVPMLSKNALTSERYIA